MPLLSAKPSMFLDAKIQDTYHKDGTTTEKEGTEKRASKFIEELLWYMISSSKTDQLNSTKEDQPSG